MPETIKCIKDVGSGKKAAFFSKRPYTVFIIEEDGDKIFKIQNIRGEMKVLFSTKKPGRNLKFLREHFDLSQAPELKQATDL